jgi:GMP reductase
MNSAKSSYSPVAHTYFSQRPVVDEIAFSRQGRWSNTLVVQQDPATAAYIPGIPLSDAAQNDETALRPLREIQHELVRRGLPSLSKLAQETVDAALNGLKDDQLHTSAMALMAQSFVNPGGAAIEKPLATFTRLLAAGMIKPPTIDLSRYSGPDQGQDLQRVAAYLYRSSGLGKLSQALGLADETGNEAGSKGWYPPLDPQFLDSSIDYGHRCHIGTTSRIAWNRWTNESLMVRNPLVPAGMRCVTDWQSAEVAVKNGMSPVGSMDYTKKSRQDRVVAAEKFTTSAFVTVRTNQREQQLAREILSKGGSICIEMANANMPRLVKMVRELKKDFPKSFIMVGNVGSAEGYILAALAGADVVKLGRGPGAGCTTPEETGISPGQVTLAYECALAQAYLLTFYKLDVPMMLDGGISKPGHVLNASVLGAETFMMGSFFAVLDESPAPRVLTKDGTRIVYYGEASRFAQVLSALTDSALQAALAQKGQGTVGLLAPAGTYADAVSKFLEGLRGGVADENQPHLALLIGTEFPWLARVQGPGAVRETATRLQHDPIESLVNPGRMDLGVGGVSRLEEELGIRAKLSGTAS